MLSNIFKSNLVEKIEYSNPNPDVIVYRFPILERQIKYGADLIVKEGQTAVIVNKGQVADVFVTGKYKLTLETLPILAKLNKWGSSFKTPFAAEVYFLSMIEFVNIKWGTPNAILLRDDDFGMVRIRAFGSFSFKIDDSALFMKEIIGIITTFSADDISKFLKALVVSSFTDMLAETKIAALDLAANYDELGYESTHRMKHKFASTGLELTKLLIENIALPEEIEKAVNRSNSITIINDKGEQKNIPLIGQGQKITDVTEFSPYGPVGQIFNNRGKNLGSNVVNCMHCDAQISRKSKFCPYCGGSNIGGTKQCTVCNNVIAFNAKFCPDCGSELFDKREAIVCKNCGNIVSENDKYCSECGDPA